jgi:hypothetical protein
MDSVRSLLPILGLTNLGRTLLGEKGTKSLVGLRWTWARFCNVNTWEGWLSLKRFWTKNLSRQTERGESCLPAEGEHWGVHFIGEAGRPGWPRASPGSVFLQHDDLPFVTFVPAWSTSCTAQTLSSTPLLALLVLPLDAFALSHVHAPLLHMRPWISFKTMLASPPPHACPLHVTSIKVVRRESLDASWCMQDLLN